MSCLADDTVQDFVHGQLSEEVRLVVDEHLDGCVECRHLISALVHTNHDLGPQAGDPFSLRQGAVVGRYMLLEMVGEGAMGMVFAAYDPELHRKVAIKFVRSSAGASAERLLREAQAMARLSHANVVTIYETGKMDGSVFIAMELVSGTTLREWLAGGKRPLREILSLFLQAARGLEAAHDAGLVHRDFKPDNVLIADDGRARVTDFGLARGDEVDSTETQQAIADLGSSELTQTMTHTGALLGTPAYMAPEQLRGEEASSSADQYAFCVTLFEALCGRRPFEGGSIPELRRASEENKLSFRSDISIPKALQSVLARGLRPKASERYPAMGELIDALEASSANSSGRWVAGGAVALAGAAAALLLLGGGSASASPCASAGDDFDRVWTAQRQSEVAASLTDSESSYANKTQEAIDASLSRFRGDWIEESTNTCKATRVSKTQSESLMDVRMQCLQRGLAGFDALTQELTAAKSLVLVRDIDQALPDVAACRDTLSLSAVAKPAPEELARVQEIERLTAKANAQAATGAYAEARLVAANAYQQAKELGFLPVLATSALALAGAQQKLGNLSEASEATEEASSAAIRSRSERVKISAWIRAIAIYGERGLYERALLRAKDADAAVERLVEAGRLRAMLANNWGTVLYRKGDYPEAREQLERSHQLRVSLLPEESTSVARSLTNLGNLERVSGNLEAALAHHSNALALDTELLGAAHPEIGRHLHNVAGVLRLQNKRREAAATYEQALALRRKALGLVHQDVALTLNSLGLVHSELNETELAKAYYEESLAAYPEAGHPQRALSLYGLGVLVAAEDDHANAQSHFREALRVFEKSFDDDHERVLHVLLALSRSLVATGARAEARRLAERAQATGNPDFTDEIALALEGSRDPALESVRPRLPNRERAPADAGAAKTAKKPPPEANAQPLAGPKNRGMYGSSPAWD